MKKNILFLTGILILSMNSCLNNNKYPETAKDDTVDNYFGTEIADPYRWLENDTAPEVAAWVKAQNAVTNDYLAKIPFRSQLKNRLTELTNYEKIGTPFKKHGRYFFYKNDGLQNQSVLYTKTTIDGEAEVLLDPNSLSDEGTVALTSITFSKDGRYLAYTISRNGSDWCEIFVMEIATKTLLPDHIEWAKFTTAEWCGNGFYYSAYDSPEAGKEFSNTNENQKIYYHTLGEPQKMDKLAYENPKYPLRFYNAETSDDERFLFVYEAGADNGNRLFVKDLQKKNSKFVEIASDFRYNYLVVETCGDTIYFYTNYKAPKYRLAKATAANPTVENWVDVVPETENVLSSASLINKKWILTYNKNASDHAFVCDINGKMLHEVALPTIGAVAFSGTKNDNEVFYAFTSFNYPNTIFRYDTDKNQSEIYLKPDVKFNPEDFVTKQLFFASKDGTQIPMFVIHKKDLQLNGKNPVLLYGYGGFNISLTPSFSTNRIPFLENGGIYAQVTLRGGGEFGEDWHLAGTKMSKQNVFDDFISAAEFLISENYTSNKKIAILGGSNGGLLVGACANQRPDLFKVAVPMVGVMDMLRYHKFTIGWNWAPDYGTSDDSREMFEYLLGYSPLHNIKNDGTPYPATLVTTADHDDRVVPAHSFKYIATLQAANTGNAPKLIRIESNAGHGAGKPIEKTLAEQTDIYAFIMHNLGMKVRF